MDADGSPRHVGADRPDGVDRWLDPLIDVSLAGSPDLVDATATLGHNGGEHLIVALLGQLDRGVAEALAGAAGARENRLALAMPPTDEQRTAWDIGAAILGDHGWSVRPLPGTGESLAAAWALNGGVR